MDPFSDARSGFVKLEDLMGRLILVIPQGIEERPSRLPTARQGDMYESITADVIVLDGPITELIEEVPMTVEGTFISGSVIVAQLKPKVKTQGMVLGRLGQQPSQTKSFGPAWVLQPPTDADKVLARPAAKAYQEQNDPFAV
jgi:hypothetical protein